MFRGACSQGLLTSLSETVAVFHVSVLQHNRRSALKLQNDDVLGQIDFTRACRWERQSPKPSGVLHLSHHRHAGTRAVIGRFEHIQTLIGCSKKKPHSKRKHKKREEVRKIFWQFLWLFKNMIFTILDWLTWFSFIFSFSIYTNAFFHTESFCKH